MAECVRDRDVVELRRDDAYLVLFRIIRPLRLLDLVGSDWVTLARAPAETARFRRALRAELEIHATQLGLDLLP